MKQQDYAADNKNNRSIKSNVDFDISTPLDYQKAVSALNGNNQLYFSMLGRFELISLNECLSYVKEGLEDNEPERLK